MAWMSDEAYELQQENREKKITGHSARNRRGHTGKGGKVRLSSDNLTQKQWEAKNGECKSYRLNEPMTWGDFIGMPEDIQIMYVKALRNAYNVPNCVLAEMLEVSPSLVSRYFKSVGLTKKKGEKTNWSTAEKEAFMNWWHKKDKLPWSGTAKFESPMDHILKKLEEKLGCLESRKVRMSVSWEVMEE